MFQNVLIQEGHVWMTSGSRLFYRMFQDLTWTIFHNIVFLFFQAVHLTHEWMEEKL